MAYISLQQAKQHLVVDDSFKCDDSYIENLIDVAEAVASQDICRSLCDLEDENGALPMPVIHAVLLLVGHYYSNREPVAFAQSSELPLSYRHLISLYRNYAG